MQERRIIHAAGPLPANPTLTGTESTAQIQVKNSSNTVLSTQSWTYDDASNVATHTQFGVQTTFGYDNANQLTSESRTGYSASYTYDGNGNRLTKALGGTTENYTYDDGDKLDYIQVGGVTTKDYGYDACGRTKADPTPPRIWRY